MRWHNVRDNFAGRMRLLTTFEQQEARRFLALVTSLNACSVLDFLDGSARYNVGSAVLREIVNLVETRVAARGVSLNDGRVSEVILTTLDDMRAALETLTNGDARAEPFSPPQGVVRGDPTLIQPRSQPREARNLTWQEVVAAMPLPRSRRTSRIVNVEVVSDEAQTPPRIGFNLVGRPGATPPATWEDLIRPPVATPEPATDTQNQREQRRARGRSINTRMDLRNGVEVDVVRHEEGRFTRAMRYRVQECHATGTLTLMPVDGQSPAEASLTVFDRESPVTEPEQPSRASAPRRRLRL